MENYVIQLERENFELRRQAQAPEQIQRPGNNNDTRSRGA